MERECAQLLTDFFLERRKAAAQAAGKKG